MGGFALLYGLATVAGAILRKFKFPMLVGFLLAGLLLGSVGAQSIDTHYLEFYAQFGAAFLLFSVGLEINFKHFRGLGWTIIWMTILQMLMVFFMSYGLFLFTGYDWKAAFIFSTIVAFSSTVLVAMVLKDRKELLSLHGRVLIGVLLIQDLIVVLLLFVIPYLAGNELIVSTLLLRIMMNVLAVLLVVWFGRWFFHWLKKTYAKDRDVIFLLTIAYLFGVMSVFSWSQLSLPVEIAGLVAGLSLSEVYVRDRITSWFDPLRNFFLVFLFFYVGSQVDVRWFLTDWDKLVVLIVIVILSKTIIGWLSAGIAGFPKKVIFMVGIGLANLSELGFVILPMSYRLGIISDRYLSLYSMLILVSIIFSAIVLHNSDKVCRGACDFFSLLERAKIFNPPIHSGLLKGKKVLVGCHRAGMSVINSLDEYKDLVVLDFDIEVINRLKSRGIEAYYCDATDKRTLLEYEICKAKMIISTIPSIKDNLVLAEHVINECSGGRKPWLVCLAKTESEVRELYNRGADLVLNPYISIATDFVGVITTSNRRLLSNQVKRVQNKLFKL